MSGHATTDEKNLAMVTNSQVNQAFDNGGESAPMGDNSTPYGQILPANTVIAQPIQQIQQIQPMQQVQLHQVQQVQPMQQVQAIQMQPLIMQQPMPQQQQPLASVVPQGAYPGNIHARNNINVQIQHSNSKSDLLFDKSLLHQTGCGAFGKHTKYALIGKTIQKKVYEPDFPCCCLPCSCCCNTITEEVIDLSHVSYISRKTPSCWRELSCCVCIMFASCLPDCCCPCVLHNVYIQYGPGSGCFSPDAIVIASRKSKYILDRVRGRLNEIGLL